MRLRCLLCLFAAWAAATDFHHSASAVDEIYELRTYTAAKGKLDALQARFRDHTVALFRKHGMESVGYWVPADEPASQNTLIYVLRHASRDAAAASWKAFLADPQWRQAARESEQDGPLLAKAPEAVFMELTDYSPRDKAASEDGPAVYELRIYRCQEGKLPLLDARFRDHTIRLFDRHGLQSVAYWHPTDPPASQDTLIYLLRYPNRESAAASWRAFGEDPEWRKVARESQRDGRFLRESPESVYLAPADYSPLR